MVSYYLDKMLHMRESNLKANLTATEQQKFIKAFKEKVCVIKKDVVIIKHNKFGYELFKSNLDNKYWSYAVSFTEPFNPLKPIYKHHWIGNAFIGYGFSDINETIKCTFKMMAQGPTGQVYLRDYLASWDVQKERIFLSWEKKWWNYEEYMTFQKWFNKNKIRIMTKQVGMKDAEDYEKEKLASPLAVILSKIQDPPQRPRPIAVIFKKTTKSSQNWADPKNKKYLVGFTYGS